MIVNLLLNVAIILVQSLFITEKVSGLFKKNNKKNKYQKGRKVKRRERKEEKKNRLMLLILKEIIIHMAQVINLKMFQIDLKHECQEIE